MWGSLVGVMAATQIVRVVGSPSWHPHLASPPLTQGAHWEKLIKCPSTNLWEWSVPIVGTWIMSHALGIMATATEFTLGKVGSAFNCRPGQWSYLTSPIIGCWTWLWVNGNSFSTWHHCHCHKEHTGKIGSACDAKIHCQIGQVTSLVVGPTAEQCMGWQRVFNIGYMTLSIWYCQLTSLSALW